MYRRIASITDVAERRLCSGCGVCASVQPGDIEMVDDVEQGRRPVVARHDGVEPPTDLALAACPGIALAHSSSEPPPGVLPSLHDAWGPILELWEGYAADSEIRYAASSGGAATALALHAVEKLGAYGVLHIAARVDVPYLNETRLSRSRSELLAATGSRYAPASPGDRLDLIEHAPDPCVFIGKPCDVAGVNKARVLRPALDANIAFTVAMFCAGTPSLRGTLEMLERMGVPTPSALRSLRYRGNGWPGRATAQYRTGDEIAESSLSYDESWGEILQRHRAWRCRVCADHTGEFADIAVGDPWYRPIPPDEPGRSLILARTERGRSVLESALKAGALVAGRVEPDVLVDSQRNLLHTRGAVWGRIATTRILGVPAPRYRNMPTFRHWLRLDTRTKLQSTLGTARRVFARRLHRRARVVPLTSRN